MEVDTNPEAIAAEDRMRYWKKCLFSMAHRGGNFAQARAMFYSRFKEWPNSMKPMPDESLWKLPVREVYPWTVMKKQRA